MNPRRNSILNSIMAAALALASCSRLPVYSHFEAVDQAGWARNDTISFTITAKQAGTYQLRLDLRTNSLFPYTQLTLLTHFHSQRSHVEKDTTLLFNITNAEGYVQGRGTGTYQYQAALSPVMLSRNDTLRISIRHGMSRDALPGIVDMGITAEAENHQ